MTGTLQPQDTWFRRMGQARLLTAEEEVALAQAIERGTQARARLEEAPALAVEERRALEHAVSEGEAAFDRFVRANLRLVIRYASEHARRTSLDLDDLIQEGTLGLIRAVERFDWRRGLKFSTYATWWIRQSLQRTTAQMERSVRLPSNLHQALVQVRAAQSRLEGATGRAPTVEELAEATRLSPAEVRQALRADTPEAHLDAPVRRDDGEGATLGELVPSDDVATDDLAVDHALLAEMTAVAERELDGRQRHILVRRYGLDGAPEQSTSEIARDLGIGRETARVALNRALAALDRALGSPDQAAS